MKARTPLRTSVDQNLESAIRKLVEEPIVACDFESGLCRYCFALVEHNDPQLVERHRPGCPWQEVRSHYFPADRATEFDRQHAA